MKSAQSIELNIHTIDSEGRGIGRDEDNRVIFVENALPNSKVLCMITEEKKNFAYAELVETLIPSPFQIEPKCEHATQCGGCTWQHLEYEKQLEYKKEILNNALTKIGKINYGEKIGITPSTEIFRYRNKMEFAFGYANNNDLSNQVILGLHAKKSHDILPVACHLCKREINPITAKIQDLVKEYNLPAYTSDSYTKTSTGFLRFLVTRTTEDTKKGQGQIVLEFITAPLPEYNQDLYKLCKDLMRDFPEISGIAHSTRKNMLSVAYGEKTIATFGSVYLAELIEISNKQIELEYNHQCFFQVNTQATVLLYEHIATLAWLSKSKNIADIYCGVGGIGISLASSLNAGGLECALVGLEVVAPAVKYAMQNAKKAGIKNHYVHGNATSLSSFLKSEKLLDMIILDPPRAGLDNQSIQILLKRLVPHIILVSCNPAALARDIHLLSAKYNLQSIHAFDLFPHTPHVESVALLNIK